ncbi:MAG: hypothetical protein C0592_10205 [Marinilabiliales bacterium]|nr:MAG: hypothetical protein C0592_10205 [Marinilabiliales bacterium]
MSCTRDRDEDDFSLRSATDNATAENMFDDMFKQAADGLVYAEDSASGRSQLYPYSGGCATVTITPFDLVTFPKTITIDFGTTNCLGNDGRYRRGIIEVVTTGWYRDSGTVITITPISYFVDDNQVTGYKTVTNMGHNQAGNLNYDIEIDGTVITSEGTITHISSRNREWIEGESTVFNPWDDKYLITGDAHGTNVEGEPYTMTILTALQVQFGCRWIQAGTLQMESGGYTIMVDYGNGDCDASAVVTINGNTYNIVMM